MELKLTFVGWCNEDNHDKIWGVLYLSLNKYLIFWGARGRTIKYQIKSVSSWEVEDLIGKKQRKSGYARVDNSKLNEVYPTFKEDLEKTAFWGMLSA